MPSHARDPVQLPHELRRIRLELAREPGHPAGDRQTGYIFVASLDAHDRIDPDLWKEQRDHCRVVRFRPGQPQKIGRLVRRPGGSWAFRYGKEEAEPDEAAFHLDEEQLLVGEYLSIREDDEFHTYRIVTVEHV